MDSRLKFRRTRTLMHIMSENEKDLSYPLGVNQFTDLTKEVLRVRTLDTDPRT